MVTKIEQWQLDVLLGINRLLEVLHDISDTVHATHVLLERQGQATQTPPAKSDDERMLNVDETAALLGITRSQMYGAFRQIGPKPIKIGKRNMYRRSDLRAWLDSRRDLRTDVVAATPTRVHDPTPLTSAFRPYRERPTCPGSGTEPVRTNQWGDGECRVCHSSIQKRANGTLWKHKTPTLYF